MNKFWKKTDDKTADFHYCKKCGCELISTNKSKLCDKCRRDQASIISNAKKVAAGILVSVVLAVMRKKK